MHYRNARHALTHAVYLCLRDRPREVFTGGDGNAAEICARAIDIAESLRLGEEPEEVEEDDQEAESGIRRAMANLLRDIFGNPFRAVTLNPAWRTPIVAAIAHTIYDEQRFADLPVLADALEEAGCPKEDILSHCRQPGEHVRGCWAVDLILGKA